MFDRNVRLGKVPGYEISWILPLQSALNGLAIQIRGSYLSQLPEQEIEYVTKPIWKWFIVASAALATMAHFHQSSVARSTLATYGADLENIASLTSFAPLPDNQNRQHSAEMLIAHMLNAIAQNLAKIKSTTDVASAVNSITQWASGGDFHRLETSLKQILSSSKNHCIILIDSADQYNPRDPIYRGITSALITTIYELHVGMASTHVSAKMAFPSEIFPRLALFNPGKIRGSVAWIRWRYRDIVALVAKRYVKLLFPASPQSAYADLDDHTLALESLYKYLPRNINTRIGISWDTMSYIVRHTQKTPRQVIIMMNTMLSLFDQYNISPDSVHSRPNLIIGGVHAPLDDLMADTLSMHQQTYHVDAGEIVKRALSEAPSYFDDSYLDQRLAELSEYRKETHLSRFDIKKLLFATGSLGLASHLNHLAGEKKVVMEGLFEYQVKDVQTPGRDKNYVVHPMFYESLQTLVDEDTLVYPIAYEDEEYAVLKNFGIERDTVNPGGG